MTAPPPFRQLPQRTQAFLAVVMAAALAALALAVGLGSRGLDDPALLVLTLVLCAAGARFEVLAPGNLSLQVSLVFFTWGAVLLPAWAIGALAVASYVATALPSRAATRWYVTAFNAANYMLAGLAAHLVFTAVAPGGVGATRSTLGLFAAAGAVVVVNHLLIIAIVHLAHQRPLSAAVRESIDAAPLDAALALTGAALAAMWSQEHLLALLAVGPLALMYRGLYVPMLRHKSRTDPKTGLYNFEHFGTMLDRALEDAARESGHLGVLMIDLDHLRAVNNRWGHLAGDLLIRGIADIITEELQPADVAARFGGEEFCVVLPGAATQRSLNVAERIRRRMAHADFDLGDGAEKFSATVSIGVAVYPEHGVKADELLDAADAAVYDAKLGGRNRVRLGIAGDTSRSLSEAAAAQAELNGAAERTLPEPEPVVELDEPQPEAEAEQPRRVPRIYLPGVIVLCAATVLVGSLSSVDQIRAKPWIFIALVTGVVLLDIVRIDVFERGQISPAAVPSIALAMLFGPLGPIFAEGVIALTRLIRRFPLVGLLADFGMLSLTGAATAAVWIVLDPQTNAALLGGGAIAGLTSYAVNAALMLALLALGSRINPIAVWREGWAWLWPHYLAFGLLAGGLVMAEAGLGGWGVLIFAMPVAMLWLGERQYITRSRSSVQELRAKHDQLEVANATLTALLEEKQALVSRMHRSYLSTITSLARTIEAKDPYTGGHTERVARIACAIAEEMGFGATDLRAINVGAVIHDIGKIGVPDRVLLKEGALAPEELEEIRRHPEISSYILADLDLPPIVKQMVRSHHERFGGGGYPDGLIGEEIPMAARILTVADALDAMTSDRPYRRARPLDEALEEIRARAGEQFCPRVVQALHDALRAQPTFAEELFGQREPLAAV